MVMLNPRKMFNKWANSWRSDWWKDLDDPNNRRRARFDMLVFDHGFLRAIYLNLHHLGDGVYRSSQPSDKHLKLLAEQGFKTIVNLRDPSTWGSYALEQITCRETGMTMIDHRLVSRDPPTREAILGLQDIIQTAERPMLLHCKSGADRAGIGSALYKMIGQGGSVEDGLAQLNIKYGHISASKTGLLDHFLRVYKDFNEKTPTPFLEWVERHYDRPAVQQSFKSQRGWSFVVDKILRRE
jgi:protein tyrosine phosphatase (PTP) superfamily phosphohydrolase (DUF442 family)